MIANNLFQHISFRNLAHTDTNNKFNHSKQILSYTILIKITELDRKWIIYIIYFRSITGITGTYRFLLLASRSHLIGWLGSLSGFSSLSIVHFFYDLTKKNDGFFVFYRTTRLVTNRCSVTLPYFSHSVQKEFIKMDRDSLVYMAKLAEQAER